MVDAREHRVTIYDGMGGEDRNTLEAVVNVAGNLAQLSQLGGY